MIYKNQDNHTYWLSTLNQCWVLMVNGIVKRNGPLSHFLVTEVFQVFQSQILQLVLYLQNVGNHLLKTTFFALSCSYRF